MKDKTEQIVDAAIEVFVNKGFIQATTQEIATVANVAEVTLYRKFTTKQNLFEYVVTKVIKETFQDGLASPTIAGDTTTFLKSILSNRLTTISKNKKLVRLLISESMAGNLPENLNFPKFIFHDLEQAIESHFKQLNKTTDATYLARQLGSILLGYTILPTEILFYKLDKLLQEELISKHVKSLIAIL